MKTHERSLIAVFFADWNLPVAPIGAKGGEHLEYQAHVQRWRSGMKDEPYFPSVGRHKFLELVVFESPIDNLNLLGLSQWGDNAATEVHIRVSMEYFYYFHNVEFDKLTAGDHVGL